MLTVYAQLHRLTWKRGALMMVVKTVSGCTDDLNVGAAHSLEDVSGAISMLVPPTVWKMFRV